MKKRSSAPHARSNEGASHVTSRELGADPVTAVIEAIGAHGDGVAHIDGRTVHIPFTLPGETVCAEVRGTKAAAIIIESPSPARIPPVCRHFGTCGGCTLQHWRDDLYAGWKQDLVLAQLKRAGVDAPSIEPLRRYPTASRRRASFTARKAGGKFDLGYSAARSHEIFALEECPILLPQIAAALPSLRAALFAALPARGEVKLHVTAAVNGLDCSIQGTHLPKSFHQDVIKLLADGGVIRAVWNDDIVLLGAVPYIAFGGVRVTLPPGAFLQAVEACERDMADFASEALAEAKADGGPLCDLFAGLGAFTFPCAKLASVVAYEGSATAATAMTSAAKQAKGIKPVIAVRRDLFRNPLGAAELSKFAAIVADPPREGAEAQCRALANSMVDTVVMMSCNPATFARDAALLTSAGFQLSQLAVFDQFKFSPHVELAAAFRRPVSKKGGRAPALKR